MEDSNILYYLVLGAIYIISRVLKKKKPQETPVDIEETDATPSSKPTPKRPSSVEDFLKELTKEMVPEVSKQPEPVPERKPDIIPVREFTQKPIDYQMENIEAIKPDEKIDIVPHKPIERKKPEYGRSEKFALEDQDNHTVSGIYEFLEQEDGPRKAIIMKEIFDRKY